MGEVAPTEAASPAPDKLLSKDFIFLCLTNLLCFIVDYSFLVTLPVYLVVLGGSVGQAGLATAASSLVQVVTVPQLGRYVDRLGKTTFMSLGMGLLLVEALVLPYVSGLPWLIAMGGLCGAALACFQTGSTTLVAELAPIHRRGQALGVFGTFTTASIAISPTVSTFVMLNSGFPRLFAMSAGLATMGLVLSRLVREPALRGEAPASRRLYSQAALLPGMGIFSITMTYGTLVSFLPVRALAMGLDNVGMFFALFAVSSVLVRILAGTVSDRVGRLPVVLPALLLIAVGTFAIGRAESAAVALGIGFVYGLGYGAAYPTLLALAVDLAGPGERASAVATFNASYSLGMATGSIAMGFLLATTSFDFMAAAAAIAPLTSLLVLFLRHPSPAASAG